MEIKEEGEDGQRKDGVIGLLNARLVFLFGTLHSQPAADMADVHPVF